jgi:hypothetical protein
MWHYRYSNMVQTIAQYLWQDAKLVPYLLPPLSADAILSRRKVVTFDNSFYEMPDLCGKYLLSADLHHDTFSLILHVDGVNYTAELTVLYYRGGPTKTTLTPLLLPIKVDGS